MALSRLRAGDRPPCQARLSTQCIREAGHPHGHVYIGSEYGHVDEDGREA